MSQDSRNKGQESPKVDLQGLSTAQLELIASFVEFVRREGKAADRVEFAAFWDKFRLIRSPLSEEEAETLAEEAVAFARGRS